MKLTSALLLELGFVTDDRTIYYDGGYSAMLDGSEWRWKRNGIDLDSNPQTLSEACTLVGKFHPTLHLGEDESTQPENTQTESVEKNSEDSGESGGDGSVDPEKKD